MQIELSQFLTEKSVLTHTHRWRQQVKFLLDSTKLIDTGQVGARDPRKSSTREMLTQPHPAQGILVR